MEWVKRWGYETSKQPVRPGIYRVKTGGHLVRCRVADPVTHKQQDRKRYLPAATLPEAQRVLDELAAAVKSPSAPQPSKPLFCDFALDVQARKEARGVIRSAAGRDKWSGILEHHLIPAFGAFRIDEIKRTHVETWLDTYGEAVKAGKAKPSSVNTRLSVLRTVLNEACALHGMATNPTEGVTGYDESEHETYTEEEPNSLTLDELQLWLDVARTDWPQFYAMILLGFVTGQRPSHLQPLRRRGPSPDVLWEEGVLLVRRSHTRGQEVMNTTKTKLRQRIALPVEMVEVLRWHVETQLVTTAQQESDLLFPSECGTMRYTSVLSKPFAAISGTLKLPKRVSPIAMRRTFQDLARGAGVPDLVARSVSGHKTATMQAHYSTVAAGEQRQGLGKVVQLVTGRTALVPPPRMGDVG